MRPLWTAPSPGECQHLEPAHECPICHPHRSVLDDPAAAILAALLVAAIAVFAQDGAEREAASEAQQLQEHQERLEVARPGAMQALRELAADVRAGRVRAVR